MACISSANTLQFVDLQTRHSADCSFSSFIDHVYFSFDSEKLNVNVVEYDISYHMPVICQIKLEDVNNCFDDECIFSERAFNHAPVKTLS